MDDLVERFTAFARQWRLGSLRTDDIYSFEDRTDRHAITATDLETAAARITALEAEVARLREAVTCQHSAIAEYYRYWTGGETRGSYDGKPERAALWSAMYKARAALREGEG